MVFILNQDVSNYFPHSPFLLHIHIFNSYRLSVLFSVLLFMFLMLSVVSFLFSISNWLKTKKDPMTNTDLTKLKHVGWTITISRNLCFSVHFFCSVYGWPIEGNDFFFCYQFEFLCFESTMKWLKKKLRENKYTYTHIGYFFDSSKRITHVAWGEKTTHKILKKMYTKKPAVLFDIAVWKSTISLNRITLAIDKKRENPENMLSTPNKKIPYKTDIFSQIIIKLLCYRRCDWCDHHTIVHTCPPINQHAMWFEWRMIFTHPLGIRWTDCAEDHQVLCHRYRAYRNVQIAQQQLVVQ